METSILSAIQKGYFQQVRLLVKSGLDVNARDSNRRTALIYCALVDDESWGVGLARTLLEAGARVCLVDRAGLGPLHYACILAKASLLRIYLGAADFDINLADYLGNTALHYAAAIGLVEAVEALLATCTRYGYRIDALNRNGHSPLDMAMQNGHGNCASLIQEAKRNLQERRTLTRTVSVPDLTSLSSNRDRKLDLEKLLHMRRKVTDIGNSESHSGLTSGSCDDSNGPTCATSETSDTSGSTSSTSIGSRPKSGRVSSSVVTPRGTTNRKRWSANSENGITRSSELVTFGNERTTAIRGYEGVIRRLRSLSSIRAVPAKDPRSNPAKLLGQNPSNLFAASRSHQMALTLSNTGSWRSTMNGLYDAFYFQFSATYRSPVKLEVGTACNIGQPNGSAPDAGDSRSRHSLRRTSVHRRPSVARFTGNGNLQPRLRKSSGILVLPPRLQKEYSLRTSISGSSTDRPLPSL